MQRLTWPHFVFEACRSQTWWTVVELFSKTQNISAEILHIITKTLIASVALTSYCPWTPMGDNLSPLIIIGSCYCTPFPFHLLHHNPKYCSRLQNWGVRCTSPPLFSLGANSAIWPLPTFLPTDIFWLIFSSFAQMKTVEFLNFGPFCMQNGHKAFNFRWLRPSVTSPGDCPWIPLWALPSNLRAQL